MFYIREVDGMITLNVISPNHKVITTVEMTYDQAADLALEILLRYDSNKSKQPKPVNDDGESKIVGLGKPQLQFSPSGKVPNSYFYQDKGEKK